MSQAQGTDMITEDLSQDNGHSESPTLPPNTGDTDIVVFNPNDARTWDDKQRAVYEVGHREGESCEGASWVLMLDEAFDIEASTPDEAKAAILAKLNEARIETAQAILDKGNKHAHSIGLWGIEAVVNDMIAFSGKADEYQKREREAQVTARRALILVTDFVNEALHELQATKEKLG